MTSSRRDEEATMIVRIWRGWTRTDDAKAYRDYMTRVALPGYADVPGNVAVYMTSHRDGEREQSAMITIWDSLDAVRAFAGDDPTRAVFYPDDDTFLVDRELTVTHSTSTARTSRRRLLLPTRHVTPTTNALRSHRRPTPATNTNRHDRRRRRPDRDPCSNRPSAVPLTVEEVRADLDAGRSRRARRSVALTLRPLPRPTPSPGRRPARHAASCATRRSDAASPTSSTSAVLRRYAHEQVHRAGTGLPATLAWSAVASPGGHPGSRRPGRRIAVARDARSTDVSAATPIACDLTVLTPQQRDRLSELSQRVLSRVDNVHELDDGYALQIADASDDLVVELAEFVALDRHCCAYMRHAVICEAGPGATWLELTGPPGSRDAIAADVGRLVPEDVFAMASRRAW
jgi:heme-degrading monooxygenase HmoA